MDKFVNQLKIAFASQYAFAIKAQNYHWNVEGQDFSQYHSLFAEIYEDVYSAIDLLAENLRKLGEYAPFTLNKFIVLYL